MSDSSTILSEVNELAAPFLQQMLDRYIDIGQRAEDIGLKSKEFKQEAQFHLKAASKEVTFAKRLYNWVTNLGKVWAGVKPKLDAILAHCTIDLGLKLIRLLPDLTKNLSSEFLDRASEICSQIIDEIHDLVGQLGKVELSTAEISRIIKRASTVPDCGTTVKFSGDGGKVVVAEILSCDADNDKIHVKEIGGFEKIFSRGDKLLKIVPQPQVEDFCLIQGGSFTGDVGVLESCENGLATVRLLTNGEQKEIKLSLLARITAKQAEAGVAFIEMVERCKKAESEMALMVESIAEPLSLVGRNDDRVDDEPIELESVAA